ncbi:ATP-binding protein, partial [Solihabitans fulvus]
MGFAGSSPRDSADGGRKTATSAKIVVA